MKKILIFLFIFHFLSAQDTPQKQLNERLKELFVLEEKNPNAEVFIDIGNTLFQLDQYSWALLWAERALKKEPASGPALKLKKLSQEKLFLNDGEVSSFEPIISLKAVLILFLTLLTLTFFSASIYLWIRKKAALYFSGACFITSFVFLLFAVHIQYFSPIRAIIINPTALYQGMGYGYELVSDRLLVSGLNVGVLQEGKKGEWLKIQTSDGMIGYVPLKSIRII